MDASRTIVDEKLKKYMSVDCMYCESFGTEE